MKIVSALLLSLALAQPVLAGDTDPLFINLTSDDGHRATMALSFGAKMQAKGHPLSVFLNDRGVFVGSKAKAGKYADQQKTLADIMTKGGAVIVCPMCMKHYKMKDADLISGAQVGNPDLTGAALFKDNSKTLTW